jgi:hypothetical protein
MVMASTQVARAAAQLHEAALDVARVAAFRSAQPQEPATDRQVPEQVGFAQDEDDSSAACHYTGRSMAEAGEVIARLPASGHPEIEAATADTVIETWDGIEVEWHYRLLDGQPADPDRGTAALLRHLGILRAIPEARP